MAKEEDVRDRLLKAVRKHSGMEDDTLLSVASHSADAGWPGFTYYKDTVEFYDKHEEDIWELLTQTAEEMGNENPLELIASFGGAKQVSDLDTFKNLLSWFALEESSRWFEMKKEQEAEEK